VAQGEGPEFKPQYHKKKKKKVIHFAYKKQGKKLINSVDPWKPS
jgi:hypothetical protein